jgi:ribosomal protein L11 methyltransferase
MSVPVPAGVTPWIEIETRVPVQVQESVVAWFMDRGATGVREDYPGLYPLDDSGPVVSGDPSEWWGEAPSNTGTEVVLIAWLPPPARTADTVSALRRFLTALDERAPGTGAALIEAREIESQDWNAAWKDSWKATRIGQHLVVLPTWEEVPADEDRLVIRIDPGMAFGTGTHFTTASCLELLESVLQDPSFSNTTVLDVGTGSGILAVASVLLGAREALAIDVDPDAVAEAARNADCNGVSDRVRVSGEPLSGSEGQFGIVLANLVAQTIERLAERIAAAVAPGGILIVSGILSFHEASVRVTLGSLGLDAWTVYRDETWVTIGFRKGEG